MCCAMSCVCAVRIRSCVFVSYLLLLSRSVFLFLPFARVLWCVVFRRFFCLFWFCIAVGGPLHSETDALTREVWGHLQVRNAEESAARAGHALTAEQKERVVAQVGEAAAGGSAGRGSGAGAAGKGAVVG